MKIEKLYLGVADYAIIVAMLVISSSIGLYFRFVGGKQKTEDEFLLAGKDMPILPVAFSLMATFMSATTLMGIPAEMYMFGTHMAFMNIGFATGIIATAYVFLPLYFSGHVSTAYEYLEWRFGKLARCVCSFAFIFQMAFFMGVVLYAPALALSAVTNLSTLTSIITIGIICTFYCTMGGMKAVLWADVFQAILMYLGIIAIIATGCLELGGIRRIYTLANEGGRLVIPSFSTDVKTRYTMWSVVLQGFIITASSTGCSQLQVQRMITVKNIKRSRIAAFISIPMIVAFQLLCCVCGIIFYVKYRDCDPVTLPESPIHSPDQLMPYYIMDTMSDYPGLPGLCVCCIFSAALSTVSSSINSLTSATMEDFIKPMCGDRMLTKTALWAQVITVAYGFLCIALTFVVAAIGHLVKASVVVVGTIGGPILALFVLAAFTTKANEKGSVLGLVFSVILGGWIYSSFQPRSYPTLPFSTDGCFNVSYGTMQTTTPINVTSLVPIDDDDSLEEGYSLSYMWITPIAFSTTIVIGYVSSLLFGCFTEKCADVSPELLTPIRRWIWYKSCKLQKSCTSELQPNTLEKLSIELHQSRL